MGNVDDSNGYYGDEFEYAIEDYAKCIKEASLKHKEKRNYIRYLFKKYIKGEPDYFQEEYDYALQEICKNIERKVL